MSKENNMFNMVQYSVWPTCCNSCQFCLRLNRDVWDSQQMIDRVKSIRENINYIDWQGKFSNGVSLLGGELFYITDKAVQDEFMLLIDDIIEKILKKSPNPLCRLSVVTNGLYEPSFLFRVFDRVNETVGIQKADINFSYDLKYRYSSEEKRQQCINNINAVHNRYGYRVGVQTITTQYFIDEVLSGRFDINKFEKEVIPGSELHLLYPHPINPKLPPLPDFNFKRSSLIEFVKFLKNNHPTQWYNFYYSTLNSGTFKFTGMIRVEGDKTQDPILSDGKELINPKCGHSKLYQCYSDNDKCLLCDLKKIGV